MRPRAEGCRPARPAHGPSASPGEGFEDALQGAVTGQWPVQLEADVGRVAVDFRLTGGLGYVPLVIHGLARPDGWWLEQEAESGWVRVTQAVEGNDYWQAYEDASAGTWELDFNVPNEGTQRHRLGR